MTQGQTTNGRLTHDVLVGTNHEIQLKTGQTVQVLFNQSDGRSVISVQLPDGSSSTYQIDTSAIELVTTAAAPSTPLPPTNPISSATTALSLPPSPASRPPFSDPNLPEDKVTLVHVTLAEDTKLPAPYESEDVAKAGAYSYRLYLPPGYYTQAKAHFPALFIMSPGGNAMLGKFKERAEEEGWIVIMLIEAKNGDWGPIYGDMLATCSDVTAKGLRIQQGLQFATGFSGGARGTSMLTQFVPGFDGELLQGAGFAFGDKGDYHVSGIPHDHPYAVFMTMGTKDSNLNEVAKVRDALKGVPFKSVTFEGGHQKPPEDEFNEGLDWLVEQAFTGDSFSEDLRECGIRQFGFFAKRWSAETDGPAKTDQAASMAALGDKLSLPIGSPEAIALKTIKGANP